MTKEKIGRCHDYTAPQTEANILSRHILELQADKGRLTDRVRELERKLEQTEKDLADYQFNYPTIKELQKENADLKEEINKIAFARGNVEEENAELKEELNKWKDEWQEQVQKATDEGYARTLQTIQLTKAKKIIKELCGMVRELNKPNVQLTNVDYSLSEAEQFIKDSEVEK